MHISRHIQPNNNNNYPVPKPKQLQALWFIKLQITTNMLGRHYQDKQYCLLGVNYAPQNWTLNYTFKKWNSSVLFLIFSNSLIASIFHPKEKKKKHRTLCSNSGESTKYINMHALIEIPLKVMFLLLAY